MVIRLMDGKGLFERLNDSAELILASGSPRRRELLGLGGWRFRAQAADLDESQHAGEAPQAYVRRLAESKARAVASAVGAGIPVVAADTIVVDGQDVLGKPADAAEAFATLQRLRGHTHQVFTAISVLESGSEAQLTELCCTDVPMRDYSDEEIRLYIASGDPFDKAGGYAIQHNGFRPVENLAGCYANVVGLPLCHLRRLLAKLSLAPQVDLPSACQAALSYACPVYGRILQGEL